MTVQQHQFKKDIMNELFVKKVSKRTLRRRTSPNRWHGRPKRNMAFLSSDFRSNNNVSAHNCYSREIPLVTGHSCYLLAAFDDTCYENRWQNGHQRRQEGNSPALHHRRQSLLTVRPRIAAPKNTTQFIMDDFESRYSSNIASDIQKQNVLENVPQIRQGNFPECSDVEDGQKMNSFHKQMPLTFDKFYGNADFNDFYNNVSL